MMIVINGLIKSFGVQPVLDIPAFTFDAGLVHAIIGANGSGKTTLLRLIAGLEPPTAGSVVVKVPPAEMVMCFQNPYMFHDTVLGNIAYGLRVRGVAGDGKLARAAAGELGLEPLLGRRARVLSAGQKQKAALARALVLKPRLLLLDEPFANLDPEGTARVLAALAGLRASGATILIVTHILNAGMSITDRVVRLERGRLVPDAERTIFDGTVSEADGHAVFQIANGPTLRVVTGKRGSARGIMAPTDVTLSAESFPSSMQNVFQGTVTHVTAEEDLVRVTVDIGRPVRAHVTPEACQTLALAPGRPIWVMFKATAVEVY